MVRALACGTVVAVLAGCGVGTDSEPRAIEAPSTTTTSTPPDTGSVAAVLYFVQLEDLVPVTRAVPKRTPEDIIESLLVSPTDTDGQALSSAIPAGTQLLDTEEGDTGLLQVNFSEDFADVQGPSRQFALGQIVLSVTGLEEVSDVTFALEGEPLLATSPERGDVKIVTACDYRSLLADPADDDLMLTLDQLSKLSNRVADLEDSCGTT